MSALKQSMILKLLKHELEYLKKTYPTQDMDIWTG